MLGALDFIEKRIGREKLLASIERVLELSHDSEKLMEWRATTAGHLAGLTPRRRDAMERVLAGPAQQEHCARSHVQLAPYAVKEIDWSEDRINVTRDRVKSSPTWDPLAMADHIGEEHLHLGWSGYRR